MKKGAEKSMEFMDTIIQTLVDAGLPLDKIVEVLMPIVEKVMELIGPMIGGGA